MKVAVSVPDEVFDRADRLARSAGRSRSDVYTAALREYVARHGPEEVTDALDIVVRGIDEATDPFVIEVGRRALGQTDW